ncbi:hypothetical protein LAT59_03075 [Candidatus Gracilibacteria bacterium]|nr:hypothetical protein [Candidatus Gracilibacteria bacterium]
MKKIVLLMSLISLFVLVSCGSQDELETELTPEEDTTTVSNESESELSEEEMDELFEEMMRQVELELSAEQEMNAEVGVDDMLIDENGELNPGLVDE